MQVVSPKAFRAIRRSRISEEIIEQVRDLIVSGRLRPGDRLPAERDLAGTFRVGRSAVREAIRVMEFLGFVEARAGQGTFVAGLPASHGHDPLTAGLYEAWSTQRKLLEVRRVLEPGLAALAARRATGEQIEKMRAVLGEQEARVQRGETFVKEDATFHLLIAQASGNEVLLRIVESLMDLLRKTREASMKRGGRPAQSLKQHRTILDAIEARDPGAAGQRMDEHIREVEEWVFTAQDWASAEPASSPTWPDAGVAR